MNSKETSCETVMPSGAIQLIYDTWEKYPCQKFSTQSRLFRALFCDIAQHFPNFVHHDFYVLLQRIAKEGQSFFLDSLPKLGKAFETSLITLEPLEVPMGWKIVKGTRLPKFLNQLFSQLFKDDGSPRYSIENRSQYNDLAIYACRYIRQVCMMWSKVELICSVDDSDALDTHGRLTANSIKAFEAFIERCSKDFRFGVKVTPDLNFHMQVLNEAHRLLRCVFSTTVPTLHELHGFVKEPWGRQGPGAVAGGEVGSEKWSFNSWPGLPRNLFLWRKGMEINSISIPAQPDARLCLVPKDFRGPRVICIEPKENQFAQQGIMDILYRHVQACDLTRRSISFLDTETSRRMCYNDAYATIDLKDASDLISLNLARVIFPRWVFKLVTRFRSRFVIIRELNRRVKTNCLATMGNATCFPLETLVFWAIALGTMIKLRDSFHPRQQVHLNLGIRVFGDDIIVPLWAADSVACALEACGLIINRSKTCTFSPVRESCGEWVFMRKPVRIFRFRTTGVVSTQSYMQWRDQLNDLGQAFMPALHNEISCLLEDFLPIDNLKRRFNRSLQRMEIYAPRIVHRGRTAELLDAAGLYAWHVHNERQPFSKGSRTMVKMGWQALSDWKVA